MQSGSTNRAMFPPTSWTRVLSAQRPDAPEARAALEELCQGYWTPVYTYLRAQGCSREEGMDLTQEFLARFIAGGLLTVHPDRGRLRSYLRQSLRNHLISHRRGEFADKRGGTTPALPLDELSAVDIPADPAAADMLYDRRWAWTTLKRAMDRMEAQYSARGRGPLFAAIKSGLAAPDLLKPYAEIGDSLGMAEQQIKLEIHRARRRLADALREEVAATLGPETSVEEELRYLLTVLAHE